MNFTYGVIDAETGVVVRKYDRYALALDYASRKNADAGKRTHFVEKIYQRGERA